MTVSAVGAIDINLNPSVDLSSQTGQLAGRSTQKIDPKILSFIQELPQGGFIDLEGFLGMQPGVKLWSQLSRPKERGLEEPRLTRLSYG
jgi:hypothetical protein